VQLKLLNVDFLSIFSVDSKKSRRSISRALKSAILLEEWKTGTAVVDNDDDESKDQSCYEF
jgi:hypothetical protein